MGLPFGIDEAIAQFERTLVMIVSAVDAFDGLLDKSAAQRKGKQDKDRQAGLSHPERETAAAFVLHVRVRKIAHGLLLLHEKAVKVRAVNSRVAHGAGRVLLALVMERGNRRRTGILRQGVALQAQQVDVPASAIAGWSIRGASGKPGSLRS